jgi:hypothetical protein
MLVNGSHLWLPARQPRLLGLAAAGEAGASTLRPASAGVEMMPTGGRPG